jgi:phage tail sheath protein FI
MMYSTPGVYTKEIATLPPSVAGVSTAIPAFVGYTQTRPNAAATEPDIARITSMLEYTELFGGPHTAVQHKVTLALDASGDTISSVATDTQVYLYYNLELYFQNGGGPCYISAVGTYDNLNGLNGADLKTALTAGINALEVVDEVTLVLIPDSLMRKGGLPLLSSSVGTPSAVNPVPNDSLYGDVMTAAINHCKATQDRFCIFDVLRGDEKPGLGVIDEDPGAFADGFRNRVDGSNYGAAYYPWLNRSSVMTLRYDQLSFFDSNGAILTSALQDSDDLIEDVADTLVVTNALRTNLYPNPSLTELSAQSLKDYYNSLKTTFVNATSGQRAKFTDILKFVSSIVRGFEQASPPPGTQNSISGALSRLKADAAVTGNNVAFYAIYTHLKANPATGTSYASALGTHDNDLDNTAWINFEADTDAVAGSNIGISLTATLVNAKRDQALAFIESKAEFDLDRLIAAYVSLYQSAVYNYTQAEARLFAEHPIFSQLKSRLEQASRLVPSQGAVAGVYAATDRERGVWKAPANVSLSGVVGPAVALSNEQQDTLNVDVNTGKSINALRTFSGKGTIVWGARTLMGNDNEWRYVSVRRFFIFAEESIQKASSAFVFEPNNVNTWVKTKTMIMNFLINQWRAGALVGDKAEDAFYVKIGLGETMTQQDILEGKMIVEVGMAVVRPAEFIVLNFTHSMPQ